MVEKYFPELETFFAVGDHILISRCPPLTRLNISEFNKKNLEWCANAFFKTSRFHEGTGVDTLYFMQLPTSHLC